MEEVESSILLRSTKSKNNGLGPFFCSFDRLYIENWTPSIFIVLKALIMYIFSEVSF